MPFRKETGLTLLSKQKFLFILVNVSIPFWTMYFANNFPLHLKFVIAIVSAIFLNLTLFLALRNKEQKISKMTRPE